jgi:hypothetical protein
MVIDVLSVVVYHCWITYQQQILIKMVVYNCSNYQKQYELRTSTNKILINIDSQLEPFLISAQIMNNRCIMNNRF